MAVPKFDAVCVIGTDKSGKKKYHKMGTVFESDKGLSLKIDSMPVGPDWNGWVSFYECKPREQKAEAPKATKASAPDADDFDDQRIPF